MGDTLITLIILKFIKRKDEGIMKNFKTIIGLILSMVMAFSMSFTAIADATTYTVTIKDAPSGHTYEAYQIFTGDLSESTLSNIKWGSGVSEAGQTALGDAVEKAEAVTDAAAFAEEVAPYLTTAAGSVTTTADGDCTISGLAAGYYLIKDQDNSLTGDEAYTSYILKVVKDTEATLKSDKPTVEKKVKDVNDSDGIESDWQDSADYDIGDSVLFQLTATLANNVTSYDTYKFVFHDTLSNGLTYDSNSLKVYVDGTEITSGYTVDEPTAAGGTLTITFADAKAVNAGNSSVITVEYTATLNENAVIGGDGNNNKVNLEYSNNPNSGGEGSTGTTPDDTVIVFTYQVVVNKVDSESNALEGAGFTLYKKNSDGEYVAVGDEITGVTTFTFEGLDDGDYKLVETTTPAGYNTMDDVEFTITAEHEVLSDSPVLTSLTGTAANGELKFTSDTTDGSLESDVVNYSGSELPETGGMGTRVLYALGGILVVAALVLLVTKKRMSNN